MQQMHNTDVADLPDTEQLFTLLALAEAGSESAAAELLGIGQSSVSRRLAALQRLSPEPLTQRTATGSKLTAAGERLLPLAREVRSSLAAVSRLMAADAAGPLDLRFGIAPELVPRFAGPLAAGTEELVEPNFVEGKNGELLADVRSGKLHGALTTWAPAGREPGFVAERVASDRIVCLSAAGDAVLSGGEIDAAEFRKRTLLLPPADTQLGLRARGALRAALLEPRATVVLGSQAAVLAAAHAGAGVGVALASACHAEVAAGWLDAATLPGPDAEVAVWSLLNDDLSERDAQLVGDLVRRAIAAAPGGAP